MSENFNQYYLIKTLSKKSSHTTYLASPTSEPKRQVVLTVFPESLFSFPRERENLLQKAQRLKKLQHAHLVSILDIGIEKEQPFVVREYLPKESLRSHLKKLSPDRLELREALTLVSQIGEVLADAHEHDLVHGNIKPENMLFDANDQIVLTDFSLVSRKDAIIRDQIAEEYAFCYLAPEQFAGTCDARSDQYALGCLTYELITGRVPFAIQTLASMMGQPSNKAPAPLSESVADLPPSLETAVLKALAKDPDERFFDFALFLQVIQSALLPSPAFPFAHSPRNRAISHPVESVEAGDVSSFPIRNHTTPPDSVSQPQEAPETFASPEVDAAEPMNAFLTSQTSMPEWAGIIPVSESLESTLEASQFPLSLSEEVDPMGNREYEEEVDDLLVTDAFSEEIDPMGNREYEEEVDDLLVTDAFVRQKAGAVTEKTSLLTKSPDIGESQSVRPQHNRRRVLRLALLSIIMAVIASAFWAARISTSDTRSPSTKKMIQVVPLTKATDILTVQPSVQATNVPTVQSSIQARNIPIAQPSSSTPAPAATPTPSPPLSYEAEATQNTLANGAQVVGCGTGTCSNGKRVGDIGLNSGAAGTLQFNNVNKNVGGRYTLTVYYLIAGSDKLAIYISVNGGAAVVLNVAQTPNGDTVGTANITISLNAGNNSIEFSNPSDPAPDLDRIVV